jgi:hypothetical protein
MYILNGPPDEVISHPSGGTYYRPGEPGVTHTDPFETWRYRQARNNNNVYEFVDRQMNGEYTLESSPSAGRK